VIVGVGFPVQVPVVQDNVEPKLSVPLTTGATVLVGRTVSLEMVISIPPPTVIPVPIISIECIIL
jgi:hypothetical protein